MIWTSSTADQQIPSKVKFLIQNTQRQQARAQWLPPFMSHVARSPKLNLSSQKHINYTMFALAWASHSLTYKPSFIQIKEVSFSRIYITFAWE